MKKRFCACAERFLEARSGAVRTWSIPWCDAAGSGSPGPAAGRRSFSASRRCEGVPAVIAAVSAASSGDAGPFGGPGGGPGAASAAGGGSSTNSGTCAQSNPSLASSMPPTCTASGGAESSAALSNETDRAGSFQYILT